MRNLALILANVTHQCGDDAQMARGYRYIGRGMMGDACPGFTLESLTDMLTFGAMVQRVLPDTYGDDIGEELSRTARYDNLGHGFVLYFSRTSWEDYHSELCDLITGIDGIGPDDEEEEGCEHKWNDDNYCSKCGADGRS